jgi:hypothetical protein
MTTRGKDMMKFINKIRFKNLCIEVCLAKISDLSLPLREDVNCIVHVWDTDIIRNGKVITYKGFFRLYPKMKEHNFVSDYYDWAEKCKKYREEYPLPPSWGPVHAGTPFHIDKPSTWTAIPEAEYKDMKEGDIKTFKDSFSRKVRNNHPDYIEMDKLIRNGRSTVLQIAAYCNVSRDIVLARRIILGVKKIGHHPKKTQSKPKSHKSIANKHYRRHARPRR